MRSRATSSRLFLTRVVLFFLYSPAQGPSKFPFLRPVVRFRKKIVFHSPHFPKQAGRTNNNMAAMAGFEMGFGGLPSAAFASITMDGDEYVRCSKCGYGGCDVRISGCGCTLHSVSAASQYWVLVHCTQFGFRTNSIGSWCEFVEEWLRLSCQLHGQGRWNRPNSD